MLTKEEFIRRILDGAAPAPAPASRKASKAASSTSFSAEDEFGSEESSKAASVPPPADTRFAQLLLEEGFGLGQSISRSAVIRSTDAVASHIPEQVLYWSKTEKRPHHTLLIEAKLTHRELLSIPAFKFRQLAHLDIAEDAVARLVAEALEGFQRGAEGLESSNLKGLKDETLCIVSIIDERDGHTGRLICFGTFNAKSEGLETFFLTEHARTWDRADARERLGLLYERQFKKLGGASWQEAFTTTDERKQAEKLLEVCTKKNVAEKELQESILDLLDTIAKGFGLRKKADAERRLRAFPLPGEHDIGLDSEERESKFGGINPFSGVTLRDDNSRLLGYIVYPLKTKADAEKLRQHLEKHNRFHNVLVVYPDANQASIELWQGREQLTGQLRKVHSSRDAADVVNLLSRFFIVSKAKVRNPSELAQELAYRARFLRRLALKQLEDEPEKGPLRDLYNAFKVALVHDQKEDEFADAFAQTITYGLLTARWLGNDQLAAGERFTRQSALKYLPAASPFLNDLFKSALSLKLDEQRGRLLWLVDDVADLLDRIDVTYVFGAGDKGSDTATDPVIHFYEPFLAAYDNKQKIQRGVFFTPRPVVSYIVRSVHVLLQKEFGLEDGLASVDTWGDVAKRIKGLKIPEGTKPDEPFVCVLDPATGTGTFLYECIEVIERTMKDRWCRELKTVWSDPVVLARWNEYVPNYLLPRMYGYELMMASYSVAHLKLSFKLAETGYHVDAKHRLNVYLTNSLEPPSDADQQNLGHVFAALAREAQEVNEIKRLTCFTVVIGNPPYAGYSANNGEWIARLMEVYKRTVRNEERQIQRLSNDYAKFLCFSEYLLSKSPAGCLGMITDSGYLNGILFRDMRASLLSTFSHAYVLDLHGVSVRGATRSDSSDKNVFDIIQGVAIGLYVRGAPGGPAVAHSDLVGDRVSKYTRLSSSTALTIDSVSLSPSAPKWLLVRSSTNEAYESWPLLTEFIGSGNPIEDRDSRYGTGIKTRHDSFAVGWTPEDAVSRVKQIANRPESDDTLIESLGLCTTSHFSIREARNRAAARDLAHHVRPLAYRPFDSRAIVYVREFICEPKFETMRHMAEARNVAMAVLRRNRRENGAGIFIGRGLIAKDYVSNLDDALIWPLYLVESEPDLLSREGGGLVANLADRFVNALAKHLGLRWHDEGSGDLKATFGPEDVFCYAYAVFFSSTYRSTYAEFLKLDFPRLPMTPGLALFRSLTRLGRDLKATHLLETSRPRSASLPSFVRGRQDTVEKASWSNSTVWIDKKQGTGFTGVPESVWAYEIGGYQVCEKWLKDRKGRKLSTDDVTHYQNIVAAISDTLRITQDIDKEIDAHGGWPDAFSAEMNKS
jgi:hypothetical protein